MNNPDTRYLPLVYCASPYLALHHAGHEWGDGKACPGEPPPGPLPARCDRTDVHSPHKWKPGHPDMSAEILCPGVDANPESAPVCTKTVGEHFEEECGLPSVGLNAGKPRCDRHWEPAIRWDQVNELQTAQEEIGRLRDLLARNQAAYSTTISERNAQYQELRELIRRQGGHLDDREAVINEVCQWWAEVAAKDVLRFAPKAAEYGAADLVLMGDGLRLLSGTTKWDDQGDPAEREKVGQEMAILFYLYGKVARALSAYAEGRWPSEDTLEDIRIYSMMLTRVRQFGRLL